MSNINELFHQRTMRDSTLKNPICKMCNLEVETAKQIVTLNTSKLYKHTRKLQKPNYI